MDYSGNAYYEQGTLWQRQHHIFTLPLYYIDYCIASVDALQYKSWMDRDYNWAWESYLSLCRLSASKFFTELVGEAGLISPFEDGCIRNITAGLDR